MSPVRSNAQSLVPHNFPGFKVGESVELASPYGFIRAERCEISNGAIGIVAGEADGKVRVEFGVSDAANVPIHWLRPLLKGKQG